MKKKVFFVFAFVPIFISAQNKKIQIDALNNYTTYCNETIHGLWPIYGEIIEFNNSLNYYKINSKGSFYFQNKNWFENENNYEVIPKDVFKKCILNSTVLGITDQKNLNEKLFSLKSTLDSLQFYRDSIFIYTKNKIYEKDEQNKYGYGLLNKVEHIFKNYNKNKNILFENILSIYNQKYKITNENNRYVFTSKQFLKGIKICKNILGDLNINDTTKILSYSKTLDSLIINYKANEEENLKNLKRLGSSNGNDPFVRYDFTVSSFEAILSHTKHFLKGTKSSNSYYYKPYPLSYYYYNENILNKYNRYGLGLIQDYNKFIDLADLKMLHQVEEPHQYKVNYPIEVKIEKIQHIVTKESKKDTTIHIPSLEGYADNHLIFLLDVSGSMNEKEKLPLLKDAFKYLLTLMRPQDHVAIVSYSNTAKVILNSTSATSKEKIIKAMDKLKSGGGTNAINGIIKAYQVANENFIIKGNNRVILATDGLFETNKITEEIINKNFKKGIALSVFFFGQTKNELVYKNLKKISELGNGNFVKIDQINVKNSLLIEAQSIKK